MFNLDKNNIHINIKKIPTILGIHSIQCIVLNYIIIYGLYITTTILNIIKLIYFPKGKSISFFKIFMSIFVSHEQLCSAQSHPS